MNDPTRALQALLQLGAPGAGAFPPDSRYHGLETATTEAADGRTITYVRRRFVPKTEDLSVLHEHVVTEGERPDTLAAKYLGDPEQSWRLCDATGVMRPEELTETPGSRVAIALPQGVAGARDA